MYGDDKGSELGFWVLSLGFRGIMGVLWGDSSDGFRHAHRNACHVS